MKKIFLIALLYFFCISSHANNPFAIPEAPKPASESSAAVHVEPLINCNYSIPANIQTIDTTVLETWAQAALIQSFEFNAADLDTQLEQLKPCFTTQGFESFYTALKTSGNIDAIKEKKLTVTSQVDGKINITLIQDNQWKVLIPLKVSYQSNEQTITQRLLVELIVGRRAAGNLGIMQVIATPRQLD